MRKDILVMKNITGYLGFAFFLLTTLLVGGALADDSVSSKEMKIGGDDKKTYFLIGAEQAKKDPKDGLGLLVILPGGNGGKGFESFCKAIYKNDLSREYLVAQAVAPIWTADQAKRLVWPTKRNPAPKMKFTTEEFIEALIRDVRKKHPINPSRIFTLGWSSGGPPSYAISLQDRTQVTGAYIAQSVFREGVLPSLKKARGRAFYIEHSPEDEVCPFALAEKAHKSLMKVRARVAFKSYEGGHGWTGNVHARIREAIRFLEKNHSKPKRRK